MKELKTIVVLTGAGISAESGISTFRDSDGLWENHDIEDVATPAGWLKDPDLVNRFYNERRAQLSEVEPNEAHKALAEFAKAAEKEGVEFVLITQNVDDLHERGGSENVLHMHGSLLNQACYTTNEVTPITQDISKETVCGCCRVKGNMRPDIVWFGEGPYHLPKIREVLERCDLFISIGTSGQVFPASGFRYDAAKGGSETAEINLEPTGPLFTTSRYGVASRAVPHYFNELCTRISQQ